MYAIRLYTDRGNDPGKFAEAVHDRPLSEAFHNLQRQIVADTETTSQVRRVLDPFLLFHNHVLLASAASMTLTSDGR